MTRSIKVPTGVLTKSEMKGLRPTNRDAYASNLMLEVLDKNPEGVTVSRIIKTTGLSRNTVLKHLERLVALRNATKKDFGYLSIYYKSGTVELEEKVAIDFGDTSYEFQTLNRGADGKYVYIQEKQTDEFSNPRVTGGLLVRSDRMLDFIKKLNAYASRLA
jgi:Winged helix-turn-helix DNA-binding